jgi:hypothetical protein
VDQSSSDVPILEVHRMAKTAEKITVYLEVGNKRTFAGAVDWPGWCRSGREEASALQALVEYGPRYARLLRSTKLGFHPPEGTSALEVVERLPGNATTDFGAPDAAPSGDSEPAGKDALQRFRAIMEACWEALAEAARSAAGKELSRGPRGGGRELEGIVQHVLDSQVGYLSRIGWKLKKEEGETQGEQLSRTRREILDALAALEGEALPAAGPRGGIRWTPRYFVRRSAWHILDHAWEIENRMI